MAVLTTRRRDRRWTAAVRQATAVALWSASLWTPAVGMAALGTATAEYQVKAVFLYNFAQFVEWPESAFRGPTAPLVIGVLGDDPFGSYLDNLVKGEKIGDRPLLVRRFKHGEDLVNCHIIFICRSEAKELKTILARLQGRSLLTVSDLDSFTRLGGMVRFTVENGKVRLRINVEAAKTAGLTISSKILRPGTVITPGKD